MLQAMKLKSIRTLATALISAVLLAGCASHYGAVTIVSDPPGAQVINPEDDSILGTTPLTTSWRDTSATRQYVAVRIKKAGFNDEISAFWVSMRHKSESAAKQEPKVVEVSLDKKE